MTKKYSGAEARKQLPKLLHDIEDGQAVEITRRGQPVAVVLSLADYRRLANAPGAFGEAYGAWRRSVDDADLDVLRPLVDCSRVAAPLGVHAAQDVELLRAGDGREGKQQWSEGAWWNIHGGRIGVGGAFLA